MERNMEKRINRRNNPFSLLSLLSLLFFLSFLSISYSLTCEVCKVSVIEIETRRSGNIVNVSGSLWYFELPRGRDPEEMVRIIQSKAYRREDIERFSNIVYISDAEINISFTSQAYNVILCTTKTNTSGGFSCKNLDIGGFQGCGAIKAEFGGEEDIPPASSASQICVLGKIPFIALLGGDPWKCITILLVLGVLIAAAYAAGISPTRAFDITIPKVKGLKGYPGYKYEKLKVSIKGKENKEKAVNYLIKKAEKAGISMREARIVEGFEGKKAAALSIMSREIPKIIARSARNKEEIKKLRIQQKNLLKERKNLEKLPELYKKLVVYTADGMKLNYSSCYSVYKEVIRIKQEILQRRMKREKVNIENMLDRIRYPNSLLNPIARALISCYDAKYAEIGKAITKITDPKVWRNLPETLRNEYLECINPVKKKTEEERVYGILKVLSKIDPEEARKIAGKIYEIDKDIALLEDHLGIRGLGIVGEINKTKERIKNETLEKLGMNRKDIENEIKEYVEGKRREINEGALRIMEEIDRGNFDIAFEVIGESRGRYLIEDTIKRSILRAYEDSISIISKREYFYHKGDENKFSEVGQPHAAEAIISATHEMEERRFLASKLIETTGDYTAGYPWIYDEDFDKAVSLYKKEMIKERFGREWISSIPEEESNIEKAHYLQLIGEEKKAKEIWNELFKKYNFDERIADVLITNYLRNIDDPRFTREIEEILLGTDESINEYLESYHLNRVSNAFDRDFEDFDEARNEIRRSFEDLASEEDRERYNERRRRLENIINEIVG